MPRPTGTASWVWVMRDSAWRWPGEGDSFRGDGDGRGRVGAAQKCRAASRDENADVRAGAEDRARFQPILQRLQETRGRRVHSELHTSPDGAALPLALVLRVTRLRLEIHSTGCPQMPLGRMTPPFGLFFCSRVLPFDTRELLSWTLPYGERRQCFRVFRSGVQRGKQLSWRQGSRTADSFQSSGQALQPLEELTA